MAILRLLAAACVVGAMAVTVKREELSGVNRTFVCKEWTWGGCCSGVDELGFGTGCSKTIFLMSVIDYVLTKRR